MDADTYQRLALRTLGQFNDESDQRVFAALEITAEAGEVANRVYKEEYQHHPHQPDRLVEELGDVLWGIACMADALGTTMDAIMRANIEKLAARYPAGFNPTDSIARVDHATHHGD